MLDVSAYLKGVTGKRSMCHSFGRMHSHEKIHEFFFMATSYYKD